MRTEGVTYFKGICKQRFGSQLAFIKGNNVNSKWAPILLFEVGSCIISSGITGPICRNTLILRQKDDIINFSLARALMIPTVRDRIYLQHYRTGIAPGRSKLWKGSSMLVNKVTQSIIVSIWFSADVPDWPNNSAVSFPVLLYRAVGANQ